MISGKTVCILALLSAFLSSYCGQTMAQTCRDVTFGRDHILNFKLQSAYQLQTLLDDCNYGDNGPFEISKDLDLALCQEFCNVIYSGRCTFFIFNQNQEICEMFETPMVSFLETCTSIGGPRAPELATCLDEATDPCVVNIRSTTSLSNLYTNSPN